MLRINGSEVIDSALVLDSQTMFDGSGRPDALLLYKFDLVGTMAAADNATGAKATGIRVRCSPGGADSGSAAIADCYRVRASVAASGVLAAGIGKLNWECSAKAREVHLLDGSQQIDAARLLDSNHLIDTATAPEYSLLAYMLGLNVSSVGKDAAADAMAEVDSVRVRTTPAQTAAVFMVPAADYTRLRTTLTEIAATFNVDAAKLTRYIINVLTFNGGLGPGETLIIDFEKFQAVKGGQNVLNNIFGDFFELAPGDVKIKYDDNADSRSVQLTIINRDRYL